VELVETEPVRRANIENTVSALGVLQPHRYVDVGAQVSGQMKQIKVKVVR
jgi:macrolide-specific efflux system membrane fusion protein